MLKRTFFPAALLGLCLLVAAAFAQDEEDGDGFTVQGSNFARYDEGEEVDADAIATYPDNTMARRYFENRLRLDVYRGNLRVGGRLLYFRPSQADQEQFGLKNEGRIDKRYLEATLEPLKLRAGHFSDLWGHGLVLSLFENRDLYFDSELDGLRAALDVGPFVVTGLSGTSEDGYLVKRTHVTGAHVGTLIGGSGLGFSYATMDSGYYPASNMGGFDWRFERGMVTLNGERAWNQTTLSETSEPEGHATYFGIVLSKWNWSLLFDYKDYAYGRFTPFQNPPTAYREIGPRLLQGREPHVLNPADEVGFQVELTGQATKTSYLTVHHNLTSQRSEDDEFIPLPTLEQLDMPFVETFVNVDQDLPKDHHVFVELGANEQNAVLWQKRMWGWVKYRWPLRGSATLELETEQLLVTDRTRDDEKFHDQLYGIAWEPTPTFSIAAQWQLTNDGEIENTEGDSWVSGEAAMQFGSGAHRLIVFYGRERGGLKCSNGVCRQVQAFSGWRVTLETSL